MANVHYAKFALGRGYTSENLHRERLTISRPVEAAPGPSLCLVSVWSPIQEVEYFITVCRYVERNALRGNLVERAEDWRWSSLWRWHQGNAMQKRLLAPWPARRSPGWLEYVNTPQTEAEFAGIRRSVL